jgi:hypothetical protein
VRLVEYAAIVKESETVRRWCNHDDRILDEAFNLTIDRFYNMPAQTEYADEHGPEGPDCRYSFKAYVVYVTEKLKKNPSATAWEAEMIAAKALAGLVRRYFRLSALEITRRAYEFVRRYAWRVPPRTLYVWMPFQIPGQRCREWLESNIPDVEPDRWGEQDRVQNLVNQRVARTEIISLSEADKIGESLLPYTVSIPSIVEEEVSLKGLPDAVAREKAEHIVRQRPSIRLLGKDQLMELIRVIFDRLAHGEYIEKEVAASFGLSQATMSRFAGSRWSHDHNGPMTVPDLWKNTALTLARHSDFVRAAQKAGVWKQVCCVLDMGSQKRSKYDE